MHARRNAAAWQGNRVYWAGGRVQLERAGTMWSRVVGVCVGGGVTGGALGIDRRSIFARVV